MAIKWSAFPLALTAAALAGGSPAVADVFSGPERAYLNRPSGIAASLSSIRPESSPLRVRLLMKAQPLLRAASSGRAADLLKRADGALEPRSGGTRVHPRELRAAHRAESDFEAAMGRLSDEANAESALLDRVAGRVGARGGRIRSTEFAPAALVVSAEAGSLRRLAAIPAVASVQPAPRPHRLSGLGTVAIGAPAWWSAGFTGGLGTADSVPADAAIESEAVDPAHPAFADVTVDNDPTQPATDHGTHTGGIIASGDAVYPGVSYGIDRLIGGGSTAYELGLDTPSGPGASDPAESINISFGSPAATDNEDNPDDVLTAVFGIGQAFGAGNNNIDGSPTVGNIGRNVLTVGGFNDVGTVASTDDVVLGISSRGPTPGGRKKPDLTAPAGAVVAPSAMWNSPPSNPDFTAMTGTSFAAPHVTGAMTLLEGAGIGDPMAQRAILINSARDWNGTSTGLAEWSPPQIGWRPEVGWGQLDLATALAERSNYRLGSVRGGEAAYYRATVPAGAKATLAYELRGYFVGFPDPGTQTFAYTQSNLDLHQYLADGEEILPPPAPSHGGGPDAIDPNDTVEQVRAPAGAPQDVIYKVEASSTVAGLDAEPFAITAAQPLTPLAPAVVKPTGAMTDPGGPVRCSQPVTIQTALINDSADLGSADATVAIDLPAGVNLVGGLAEQEVSGGDLDPLEASESHSWSVVATSDGPKEVAISGTGTGLGTEFHRTSNVTIEADCVEPDTRIDRGPGAATNEPTPIFEFSSPDGDRFECSVDGGAYQSCASPTSLEGLGRGDHAFAVRARDSAGNVDPTPASRSFTVDRSVAGPALRPLSRRLAKRGRLAGAVRVRLAEPGTVHIDATASVANRSFPLRRNRLRFAGAGHRRVAMRVPPQSARKLRRLTGTGRRIVVTANAAFTDALGNEASRIVSFRLRVGP